MENNLINTAHETVRNWWISLVIGILSLILGVIFIFQPVDVLFTLVTLFVIGFFIIGLCEIIFAITNRNFINGWELTLAVGILDILVGILLLSIPAATPVIVFYLIGSWIMFQSIWAIEMTFDIRKRSLKGSRWEVLLGLAILGLIFSFIFIIWLVHTFNFIIGMATVSFIAYGIYRIFWATQFR